MSIWGQYNTQEVPFLRRPFTKRSLYEMNQMAFDLVNNSAANPDVFILPDQSRPVLQFSLVSSNDILDLKMLFLATK